MLTLNQLMEIIIMKRKPANFTKDDYGCIYFNSYGEECTVLPGSRLINCNPLKDYVYNVDRNELTGVIVEKFNYQPYAQSMVHTPLTINGVYKKKVIVKPNTVGMRLAKKKWLNKYYPVYITDNFYTDLDEVCALISAREPNIMVDWFRVHGYKKYSQSLETVGFQDGMEGKG